VYRNASMDTALHLTLALVTLAGSIRIARRPCVSRHVVMVVIALVRTHALAREILQAKIAVLQFVINNVLTEDGASHQIHVNVHQATVATIVVCRSVIKDLSYHMKICPIG